MGAASLTGRDAADQHARTPRAHFMEDRDMNITFLVRRLVVALALLGLLAEALPAGHAAAGGPTISAFYDFPSGYIHVYGSGFTPDGKVRVYIRAGHGGDAYSDEQHTVAASRADDDWVCFDAVNCTFIQRSPGGTFGLWSNESYCPYFIDVVATDLTTGLEARVAFTDTRCPG